MPQNLRNWLSLQFEETLGFSDGSLIEAVMKIQNPVDAKQYLQNFFGDNSALISQYIQMRFQNRKKNKKSIKSHGSTEIARNYVSPCKAQEKPMSAASLSAAIFGNQDAEVTEKPDAVPKPVVKVNKNNGKKKSAKMVEKQQKSIDSKHRSTDANHQVKKSRRFRKFQAETSKAPVIPGRHMCDCQAQKHELIENCQNCGRIICAQEGHGDCLFCGNSSKVTESEDFWRAVEHKNRLLDYDRRSTRRTKVIDDHTDYYKGVSEDKIREHRHGSRINRKFTLNLKTEKLEQQSLLEFIDKESKSVKETQQEARNFPDKLLFNEDLGSMRLVFNVKNRTKTRLPSAASKNRVQEDRNI